MMMKEKKIEEIVNWKKREVVVVVVEIVIESVDYLRVKVWGGKRRGICGYGEEEK